MTTKDHSRVAIVHDWLTGMRGGEAVLEAIAEVFPEAPIFSLIAFKERLSPALQRRKIITSWMQHLPWVEARYRHYLPLMPWAIESLNLKDYDLILSSSHCVAKGVIKKPGARHVCYLHAPMRYMWDRFEDYFNPAKAGWVTRAVARMLRPGLQRWDVGSSRGVDVMIANSRFIAEQARRIYGADPWVLHPFAELERFKARERKPEDFYLMVGAFAPYKRVDLAIEAFNRLGLKLWIVGSGQEEQSLRALAGPTIRFMGSCDDQQVAELYSRCRAFVFPGIEDFGITPLEAMAAGAPVLALASGGALETVTPETGIFFNEPRVDSLMDAVSLCESSDWQSSASQREQCCRARAAEFSKKKFQSRLLEIVNGPGLSPRPGTS
jgi:glycosyltransferase involved in cell wall biosynthesis